MAENQASTSNVTDELKIPLLQGADIFSRERFNDAYRRIDEAALPIEHAASTAHFALWQPGTVYKKQDVVKTSTCQSWGFFMCTVAGTSGSTEPHAYGENDTVTDGTCTWILKVLGGPTVINHTDLKGRNYPDQHTVAAITGLQDELENLAQHTNLQGRSAANQHPIAAITNLQTELNKMALKSDLTKAISDLLNGAPAAYDTLKEIADALAADDTAISGILTTLANKVDKISGKGLSSNDYDTTAKTKVDKLGEQNGKLTYNGNPLVGGAGAWAANKKYDVGELVVIGNLLYRCKTAYTSADPFDPSKWQQLTIGYIPPWTSGVEYEPNMVVTRGNSILRCIAAHTSLDFNNVEKNNWEILAGKGANLPEWQPHTDYEIGESVVYNDAIYRAIDAHTSGDTFRDDMLPGFEKWKSLSDSTGTAGYSQVTKLGVVAPKQIDIPIQPTNTFCLPAIEVLKFTPGAQDQVVTACDFNNGDAGDFVASDRVMFDGTMRLKTDYEIQMGDPVPLEDGYVSESEWVDFADYKAVEDIDNTFIGTIFDVNAGCVIDGAGLIVSYSRSCTGARCSKGQNAGKKYFEVKATLTPGGAIVGLCDIDNDLTSSSWQSSSSIVFLTFGSTYRISYGGPNYTDTAFPSGVYSNPGIIGVAIDFDAHEIKCYYNGTKLVDGYYGDKITQVGTMLYPFVYTGGSNNNATMEFNFGLKPFVHQMPDGYQAWDKRGI